MSESPVHDAGVTADRARAAAALVKLLDIMARLRGPGGCPWDREQTLASLKPYAIEEAYEVLDAIDSGDPLCHEEELGDLLLQVVFQAQLRAEEGAFGFADVAERIAQKLVHRHPHVFADLAVSGSSEVLRNWDRIKAGEKRGGRRSAVDGVPRHLPALQKAQHIQSRAARVGFDWKHAGDVIAKIEEEVEELKGAVATEAPERIQDELGDLLFTVVNVARFLGLSAEESLQGSVGKFAGRFRELERRVQEQGRTLKDCTLDEMDGIWESVKNGGGTAAHRGPAAGGRADA